MRLLKAFYRQYRFCLALSVCLFPATARAEGTYAVRVSTTVLAALRLGPNAETLFADSIPQLVNVDREITFESVSSASARGQLLGRYRGAKVSADVRLDVTIASGTLETSVRRSQLDAVMFDWEERYGTPAELERLHPRLKNLTFQEDEGFIPQFQLKRQFDYLLTMTVPVDLAASNIGDAREEMSGVNRFVSRMEGEKRARWVLSQNASGLPTFVSVSTDGVFSAHHPFHDIVWDSARKRWNFVFSAPLESARDFPEVARALKDPEVRQFVLSSAGLRVGGQGDPKGHFVLRFMNSERGEMKVTLERGRILREPKGP